MLKNYVEVRDWLENFIPLVYGKENLGLARIENLLKLLGNPQKKFKSVLVAGTAGKGSTAFYVAKLLEVSKVAKGTKVSNVRKIGLHISPHLVDIRERMQINGSMIPIKGFVGLANGVKPIVDDIIAKQPRLTPSYFEILVAMTFLYFAKEKVDWAVVEVGLGGRLDATNVLNQELSVITNVGLDHTEILGNTVEEIAWEKAGIIKTNVTKVSKGTKVAKVVTAASGKALKVIEKVVKSKTATLITLNTQDNINQGESDALGYVNEPYYILRQLDNSFASQNKNLALLSVLSLGVKLDLQSVKRAFSNSFSGRFELNGGVVLDGAHNPDKVRALIKSIKDSALITHHSSLTLVIAFKKGKRWKKMVDLLVSNLPVKSVIATEYHAVTDTGLGSAVDATEIAKYVKSKWRVKAESNKNSQEAVYLATTELSNYQTNQLVLVTGSLYLIGEARTLWHLPEF